MIKVASDKDEGGIGRGCTRKRWHRGDQVTGGGKVRHHHEVKGSGSAAWSKGLKGRIRRRKRRNSIYDWIQVIRRFPSQSSQRDDFGVIVAADGLKGVGNEVAGEGWIRAVAEGDASFLAGPEKHVRGRVGYTPDDRTVGERLAEHQMMQAECSGHQAVRFFHEAAAGVMRSQLSSFSGRA